MGINSIIHAIKGTNPNRDRRMLRRVKNSIETICQEIQLSLNQQRSANHFTTEIYCHTIMAPLAEKRQFKNKERIPKNRDMQLLALENTLSQPRYLRDYPSLRCTYRCLPKRVIALCRTSIFFIHELARPGSRRILATLGLSPESTLRLPPETRGILPFGSGWNEKNTRSTPFLPYPFPT